MCLSREQRPSPYLVGEQVGKKTDPVTVENKYKSFFIQPAREAESARAVTGRRCPHSGEREGFLTGQPGFFYKNCCISGMESKKIDPKVGNERPLRGLQTGR